MQFGPHAIKLAKAAVASKRPVPEDAIPPRIPARCKFAYDAFRELSTERELGFGAGPIRFTALSQYASRFGLSSRDRFEDFVTYVRAMDEVWLANRNAPTPPSPKATT